MVLKKMSTSWGNYLAGLFFGIFCASASRYFNGAEAIEKDVAAAFILWGIGIVLVIVLSIFTRPGVTKINDREVDLCDVKITTTDLAGDRVRLSVSGLEKRKSKEAFEIMDAIKDLCGSVRGDKNEV